MDFGTSFTEEQQREGIEYNCEREEPIQIPEQATIPSTTTPDGATKFAAMSGTDAVTCRRERPDMSAFALEDGVVYHTYSTYSRGLDGLWTYINASTGHRWVGTKTASGGAVMTNTNRWVKKKSFLLPRF